MFGQERLRGRVVYGSHDPFGGDSPGQIRAELGDTDGTAVLANGRGARPRGRPGVVVTERVPSTAPSPTADDGFERACRLDELELDQIRRIDIGGRELCLVHTVAGLFAFGSVCPHQGGPMCEGLIKGTMEPSPRNEYTFALAGEVVACPWHGYEFDLRTGGQHRWCRARADRRLPGRGSRRGRLLQRPPAAPGTHRRLIDAPGIEVGAVRAGR